MLSAMKTQTKDPKKSKTLKLPPIGKEKFKKRNIHVRKKIYE